MWHPGALRKRAILIRSSSAAWAPRASLTVLIQLMSFMSLSVCFAGPPADVLWKTVNFVHLTNILRNHTVVPGATKRIEKGDIKHSLFLAASKSSGMPALNPIRLQLQEAKVIPENVLPFDLRQQADGSINVADIYHLLVQDRITSHWSVAEPVQDVPPADSKSSGTSWEDARIGIVEPAQYFKGQLGGGFDKDMMIVGPHELGHEAYIIAPESLAETLRKLNPKYPGKYWFYPDKEFRNAREAIYDFNQKVIHLVRGADVLKRPKISGSMTKDEAKRVFLDLLSLGKSKNSVYEHVRGTYASNVDLVLETDEAKFYQTFVVGANVFADASLLYVNGLPQYGIDYFESWIASEKFQWICHSASIFRELEKKVGEVFDSANMYTLIDLLAPKPIFSETINREVTLAAANDLMNILEKVRVSIQHLSPATRKFFSNYARIIEINLRVQLFARGVSQGLNKDKKSSN